MSGCSLDRAIEQGTSSPSGDIPCPAQHPRFRPEKVPEGLKKPCRPRDATSDCLNKKFPDTGSLYFQTIDDAKASMDCVQWRAPVQDGTIPQTDEDHRDIAKQLVNAFKEMSVARDTEGNAYRKRLSPTHDSYYGDWAIEACAWDIIRMVKAIHTEGFKAAIYDKTVIDSIGQTQLWTFKERIDWICMALKTSKANAVSLMKNEKIWTIIGAPHKLYSSTLTNSVSNKHRGVWVIHGRNADPDHQPRTKRQRTHHTPSSSVDVKMGTEEIEDIKVGRDAGAVENNQSGVAGGNEAFQATEAVQAAKATQAMKTTATIKPACEQYKLRESKYDITPMPASYTARNQGIGLPRSQPPGLPIRNNTSFVSAPLPLQQQSFWHPVQRPRDVQMAKNAQMVKLTSGGELPKRNEQVANDAQIVQLMFGELPTRDDKIWVDIATGGGAIKSSTYKHVVEKAVAGKECGFNNSAAATKGTAVTQVYNQPVPQTFSVQPQRMYDAATLEDALLLASLKEPR
ncbi:hypothetical protein CFE70_004548 [Pyrenophora teres f. teres 0-1]|uniref:Uncharacterized protein n=1 Tax=Pyrenophora teres f. teres (strain 0-1) TaxID=861557 RepID=E3RHU4_PYRTT|nr:hypothetical protein PTT_07518 [Pyrenophora teres f. teres 0-1]KAE8840734.1 hypothetical protein PTNB85_04133 [Pyrenophora teres f. teres]KAE8849127.1 hypothetical protein HRS9122_03143 [Pyrenophora teres f. teres]